MSKLIFKSIGTLCDVEVVAALPSSPMDLAYCFCKHKGIAITTDIITFPRSEWDDTTILTQCFEAAIGIGISVALQNKLIMPDKQEEQSNE